MDSEKSESDPWWKLVVYSADVINAEFWWMIFPARQSCACLLLPD